MNISNRGGKIETSLSKKYKQSLRNLGKEGVTRICYNFMPVLDWLRTDVQFRLKDGSTALLHDKRDLIIFDLFVLKRENAEEDYETELLLEAKEKHSKMSKGELEKLKSSLLMAIPGDEKSFTLEKLKNGLNDYKNISARNCRRTLYIF